MKTLLCLVSLTIVGVSLAASPSPKAKTYFVAGYFDGRKPSAELVQQAAQAIGEKLAGYVQVQDREEADRVVEVLFRLGKYQIFVDALPLQHKGDRLVMQHSLNELVLQGDRQREAEGQGRTGVR